MSKFEEMIQVHCPNGVPFKTLDELAENCDNARKPISSGNRISGMYPYYGASGIVDYVDGYIFDGEYLLVSEDGANLLARSTPIAFSIFGRNWVNNHAHVLKFENSITRKFVEYYINAIDLTPYITGAAQPKLNKKNLNTIPIPVPPMDVQHEIVRVLDNFTELIELLTTELKKRNEQYMAISNTIFERIKQNENMYVLSDVCVIEKGKTPIQKAVPGEYPLVVTTSERKTNNIYQFDAEALCIPLVSSRGHGVACLNHVYYQDGKFALGNILCAVIPKDVTIISAKYLYYYFEHTKDFTLVPLMKGGANVALHISDIEKIKIPIPSLDDQKNIVKQLDIFNSYCNNELPAEFEARKQQYEYYRDKLLTFKELEN